jgi:acyl dehydratase
MLRRMIQPLRFAEFSVGQRFESGTHTVTLAEIKDFARQFDPQPYHLDEQAAAASPFGALVASGWHTACVTMRLLVEGGMPIAGGILGAGIDELRWLRPVRPGETLRVESEVLEITPSASRPGGGRMRVAARTFNQDGVQVLGWIGTLVVRG